MKKLVCLLLAAVMLLSLVGCGSDDQSEYIQQLEEENLQLRNQIQQMALQLEEMGHSTALSSWLLKASARKDLSGAQVTLTATPLSYHSNQTAAFLVRESGVEAAHVSCEWDGSAYTATLDLDAYDGYSYYCVLTGPDGNQQEIALNTPESPVIDTLVYMETALSTYANLIVTEWEAHEETLDLTSGYIQVQTPRLSSDGNALTLAKAELVLKLDERELSRQEVVIPEGEGKGSYELAFDIISLELPEVSEGQQLELWLEVQLSNKQTASAYGGSWCMFEGQLELTAG